MRDNPHTDPRTVFDPVGLRREGPPPEGNLIEKLGITFQALRRFLRLRRGTLFHPGESVPESKESSSPAFHRDLSGANPSGVDALRRDSSREPVRVTTHSVSHSQISHELFRDTHQMLDPESHRAKDLGVERGRNQSEGDFAGSREPTPFERAFLGELEEELQVLHSHLKNHSDLVAIPILKRILREVVGKPGYLLKNFQLSLLPIGTVHQESGVKSSSSISDPGPVQVSKPGDPPDSSSGENFEEAEGERR